MQHKFTCLRALQFLFIQKHFNIYYYFQCNCSIIKLFVSLAVLELNRILIFLITIRDKPALSIDKFYLDYYI